ncbi:MAG TPA: tRNA (adenosine(37)-N6)-threonylcarbamoyltransferase complex dimerization subunit type 1 TsaB [Chitinophagaceae bacterium]|nr:tRNA (adenosine(37)-N6)-threonylcarbamoyltransferase complex dimerization subunit type 1 TsaB [Chitinophagaceae bacterium]
MSLILNIDTALDTASVCLAEDGNVLQFSCSEDQKDHASWLHTEIAELLQKSGHSMKDLDAVAVSVGPGSYTGLRVGLAAAKGFCYALHIPLITINSLTIIAFAVKDEAIDMICPLIDARRMEVFTAMYDKNLREKVSPHTMVVDEKSFASFLLQGKVLFCGNGIKKLQPLISNNNALFSNTMADASHLARLSFHGYNNKEFADLAYAEPLYIKEFYSPAQGVD